MRLDWQAGFFTQDEEAPISSARSTLLACSLASSRRKLNSPIGAGWLRKRHLNPQARMLLTNFRVRVFRNVIDSGPIDVLENTCLVGKNEAGKSALLEALYRLNPARPEPLDLLEEYPRWLKKAHEISGEIESAVPIEATFTLTDAEYDKLSKQFGDVFEHRKIAVSRAYKGDLSIRPSLKHKAYVDRFVSEVAPPVLKDPLAEAGTPQVLLEKLEAISKETVGGEPTPEAQAAKSAKVSLAEELGGHKSLTGAVNAALRPLVPRMFRFSQYSQLRGRYTLDEVLAAVADGSDDEELQAAADFLKLARVTPTSIEDWDFEASNAELEAVSSLLTQRVRENWKQNPHLKLRVRIESTHNTKTKATDRFLQFRVEDTRHDFSNRLDRRSTGFRWFVSFVASFFEFEGDKDIILLLDEPGLSLHARAQKDLLDAIDNHLAKGRQVVYTTHSPFMVRTEALQRAHIVEDGGPEVGSRVTNDAGSITDPDTLFPLQAALGYDIAQNLFIGNRNILLEGTSDVIYLEVLSSHLDSLRRSSLPDDARRLPCGGATNIPTFLALLGTQLDLVVLLDGKAPGQKIENAIAAGKLSASRVLRVDAHCSVRGADIEDLFEPIEYLDLYNATFGESIALADLSGDDRIVKRIERKLGREFNHGRVANYFLVNQAALIPELSPETLSRFEGLIKALTAALPVAT